jgi:hypothetical protein
MLLDPVYEHVSKLVGAPADQLKVSLHQQWQLTPGHLLPPHRLSSWVALCPTTSVSTKSISLVLYHCLDYLPGWNPWRAMELNPSVYQLCRDLWDRGVV